MWRDENNKECCNKGSSCLNSFTFPSNKLRKLKPLYLKP